MPPSSKALYPVLLLLILALLLLSLDRNSRVDRLPRLWRIIQDGLNQFDYPPAP